MDCFTPVTVIPAIKASTKTFERLLSVFLTETATDQLGGTVSNMVVLGVEKI
jgi:hypothetical protein